jgi:ATP-dependent helicase/nuclease subunit B
MAVRFVMGRAGTGKTRHCFDAIVAAMRADPLGPPIYWILPKQATFSAERELTTDSGLDAFCRARVLSFELLGEEVLAACGGSAIPEVSSLGRQMLIGHLLRSRQKDLKFFRGVARQPGLAARLDSTFAEFERCGKDPSSLAEAIDQLGAGDARAEADGADAVESTLLADKLRDFHLLYQAYRDTLGNERLDPHRRLEQVLSCIDDHPALRGASIYIDGFLEFTDRERRMIVALAQAASSVDITLLIDPRSKTIADLHHLPDDLSLFHRTESHYRLLMLALQEVGIVLEPPVLLREPRRFANDTMAGIERSLFDGKREQLASPRSVKLIEAPDRRTEVDAVARRVRAMLRTKADFRFRDMAVLARDIDDYEQLIAASFREHEIPYFVDRRKPAAHHPLLQFTRAVLLIARHNWPHEAVVMLLKSGLSGISMDDADELENYVLLHRLRSGAWTDPAPWLFNRTLTRERDDEPGDQRQSEASRMDELRRTLADRMAPFAALLRASPGQTVRDVVKGVFEVFKAFGVAETVGNWIDAAIAAKDPEQRGEHEQVWAELVELFDQMVDLLGDEKVDLADFMEILDVGLEQFDLALTPPCVDQVLVGQVDRTRTTSLDTVFLLGLSEGQFPRIAREDSVLSDSERRSLRSRNLDIDPESERRQLDENLLGYIAFTRASRRLIISRPASEENKPVNPSSFWRRLREMFPDLNPTRELRESEAGPESIGTPRQLVTALMRWARRDDAAADHEQPWASLYEFLAGHKDPGDAIGVMRYKAWRALDYKNEARLSPEVSRLLIPAALTASVTRIETFAACPFKHFARHHLGLQPREEQDVTPMDLGNVYHSILERLVRQTLEDRQDWCDLKPQITEALIEQFAGEIAKALRGELMLSSARNQYLLKRIRKTLERVCAAQQAALSRGAFRPAFAELGFGLAGSQLEPLKLTTPKGREVLLRGKIDRVDRAPSGEVAVIDYKMSNNRLRVHAVYHGLSLQLVTYLLVLEASGEDLFQTPVTPTAAFYAKLLRSYESIDHPDDAPDPDHPAFHLRTKPRGIFDKEFLPHLDADLQSGDSEVVQVFIKQDGSIGRPDSSDAADSGTFAALLRYVRNRIGELADQLIEGVVAVRPYRIGQETPCPNCDFRAVCRFDPAINPYLNLTAMKRSTALEAILREAGDGE